MIKFDIILAYTKQKIRTDIDCIKQGQQQFRVKYPQFQIYVYHTTNKKYAGSDQDNTKIK